MNEMYTLHYYFDETVDTVFTGTKAQCKLALKALCAEDDELVLAENGMKAAFKSGNNDGYEISKTYSFEDWCRYLQSCGNESKIWSIVSDMLNKQAS